MSREKIISLAIRCNILNEIEMLDSNPWRQDTIRELTEFYHKAQAEAFEAAAKVASWQADGESAAIEIREMAKEILK